MDIDIDFQTTFNPLEVFKQGTLASTVQNKELKKHPSGVYLQPIPKDPITNLSAIPYKQAEDLGFIKIDCLHLSILDDIESKQKVRELSEKEPNWDLLLDQSIVCQLFQIHKHFDIVYRVKPKSVLELADVIALIRPGGRKLLDLYLKDRKKVRKFLYAKEADRSNYRYKKAHAICYALTVVLQLNLISEQGINTALKGEQQWLQW